MAYVFDPETLHGVAKRAVGKPVDEMVRFVHEELSALYPGHIRKTPGWSFNNAGGAMGAMWVLHASITEYVIIFGTPIGTEGHSGRFLADDFFMILEGEQWAYEPGELDKHVYKPGDMHIMKKGSARGYRIPERCWALEYARGIIPLMLPFGVADTLTSTLDLPTLGRTFWLYADSTVRELLQGKV